MTKMTMVITVETTTFLKVVMNTTLMKITLQKMKKKAKNQAKKRVPQRKRVMRMSLTSTTWEMTITGVLPRIITTSNMLSTLILLTSSLLHLLLLLQHLLVVAVTRKKIRQNLKSLQRVLMRVTHLNQTPMHIPRGEDIDNAVIRHHPKDALKDRGVSQHEDKDANKDVSQEDTQRTHVAELMLLMQPHLSIQVLMEARSSMKVPPLELLTEPCHHLCMLLLQWATIDTLPRPVPVANAEPSVVEVASNSNVAPESSLLAVRKNNSASPNSLASSAAASLSVNKDADSQRTTSTRRCLIIKSYPSLMVRSPVPSSLNRLRSAAKNLCLYGEEMVKTRSAMIARSAKTSGTLSAHLLSLLLNATCVPQSALTTTSTMMAPACPQMLLMSQSVAKVSS